MARKPDIVEPPSGWLVFSSLMLAFAGIGILFDGIWALRYDETPIDAIIYDDNLTFWGWLGVIAGIGVIVAGIAAMNRNQFARWIGIIGASVAIVVRLPWLWWAPIQVAISLGLCTLVLYGFVVHGRTAGEAGRS